ncbi:MAG: DUF1559 domain-containing protein [Pirellulaceae bacterium]|nr:DUF1559 domain-containing protein [Pirellulaceae bacterium]
MYKSIKFFLVVCCVLSTARTLSAQVNGASVNGAQANAPQWLDDQAVGVIRISVTATNTQGVLERLAELLPANANELNVWRSQSQAMADAVKAAGGEELLIVYSLADDFADQPLWVVPKAKNLDIRSFQSSLPGTQALSLSGKPMTLKSFEFDDATVVGTKAALERAKANKTQPPATLLESMQTPYNTFTLSVTMNADQRRAAAEMLPQVPPFLGGGATRDLLSKIQSLRMDLVGESSADLVFTLTGDATAVEARAKNIKDWLDNPANANSAPVFKMLGKFLVDHLTSRPPKSQGQTASWKVPIEAVLKSGASELLSSAMLQADEQRAAYHLRTLALAIHNHYSAMKRFPSPLSGLDGKSPRRLSWRVDLLPFLDQNDLYQQFRLDEAWDSPHNRSLISKMPNVFRVPQSKHAVESGLSTFVLPSNAVTMWPADREIDFKDIADGSSNTMMIVEVKDEFAQEWTKPEPFEINMQNPASQLGGHFKDKVFFAAGDGSTGVVGSDKFMNLPALLTRAGGEAITW